jgi:hypothetical protein
VAGGGADSGQAGAAHLERGAGERRSQVRPALRAQLRVGPKEQPPHACVTPQRTRQPAQRLVVHPTPNPVDHIVSLTLPTLPLGRGGHAGAHIGDDSTPEERCPPPVAEPRALQLHALQGG